MWVPLATRGRAEIRHGPTGYPQSDNIDSIPISAVWKFQAAMSDFFFCPRTKGGTPGRESRSVPNDNASELVELKDFGQHTGNRFKHPAIAFFEGIGSIGIDIDLAQDIVIPPNGNDYL